MRLTKLGHMAIIGTVVGATALIGAQPAQAVGVAETKVGLTATSKTNPPPAGQIVYLRASVKPVVSGGAAPVGNVTFFDGAVSIGVAPLVTAPTGVRVATLQKSFTAGTHSLTARFPGDPVYAVSTSPAVSKVVTKAASKIVASRTAGAGPGTSNIVGVVKPSLKNTRIPSGMITIKVDNLNAQTVLLNSKGRGHITIPLANGNHTATFTYGGDSTFLGSTATLPFTTP